MHSTQEVRRGFIATEIMIEQGVAASEDLGPPMFAVPHRVFEVIPKLVQRVVGIPDVAIQGARALRGQKAFADDSVPVSGFRMRQQSERDAAIEETHEGRRINGEILSEFFSTGRSTRESIENSKLNRSKHRL